jgi:hypothetical protein
MLTVMTNAGADSSAVDPTALVALVLSGITLAWNILDAIYRRPHLYVELAKAIVITTPPILVNPAEVAAAGGTITTSLPVAAETMKANFVVTVINTGGAPATVWDVGLMLGDGTEVSTAQIARANHRTINGPGLPMMVDAHGVSTWIFPDAETAAQDPSREIYGWLSEYRPTRRFDPLRKLRLSAWAERQRSKRLAPKAGPDTARRRKSRAKRANSPYARRISPRGEPRIQHEDPRSNAH